MMVMLSTLSPHGTLVAEQASSWPYILVFAVMAVAAVAAAWALKKS